MQRGDGSIHVSHFPTWLACDSITQEQYVACSGSGQMFGDCQLAWAHRGDELGNRPKYQIETRASDPLRKLGPTRLCPGSLMVAPPLLPPCPPVTCIGTYPRRSVLPRYGLAMLTGVCNKGRWSAARGPQRWGPSARDPRRYKVVAGDGNVWWFRCALPLCRRHHHHDAVLPRVQQADGFARAKDELS